MPSQVFEVPDLKRQGSCGGQASREWPFSATQECLVMGLKVHLNQCKGSQNLSLVSGWGRSALRYTMGSKSRQQGEVQEQNAAGCLDLQLRMMGAEWDGFQVSECRISYMHFFVCFLTSYPGHFSNKCHICISLLLVPLLLSKRVHSFCLHHSPCLSNDMFGPDHVSYCPEAIIVWMFPFTQAQHTQNRSQ